MIDEGFDKLIKIKRLTIPNIQDILNSPHRALLRISLSSREFELIEIIENIQYYSKLVAKAEMQVDELMAKFNSVITTVFGIGT